MSSKPFSGPQGGATRVAVLDGPSPAETPMAMAGSDGATAGPGARVRRGVVYVATAATLACGPRHADHGLPVGDSGVATVGEDAPMAYAAVDEGVRAERVRVVLLLRRSRQWDETVHVKDPLAPEDPLVDTRSQDAMINRGAIEATRRTVVVTLALPRGQETKLDVELGRKDRDNPDVWKFSVTPQNVLETYGTDAPIAPDSLRVVLQQGSSSDSLSAAGETRLPMDRPQWVGGALRRVAVGEMRNTGPSLRRVDVTADTPGCRLVVDGAMHDASNSLQVEPEACFGVVAFDDEETLPVSADSSPKMAKIAIQDAPTE